MGKPFLIANRQALLATDVGKVIYHGEPCKHAASYLLDDGAPASDDHLWEVVVQGYLRAAHSERCIGIDNKRG